MRRSARVPDMGNNLRTLREARGWTFDQAAVAFRMSRSGYQKIERGERKLTAAFAVKAAAVYGVSETAVIGDTSQIKLVGYVGGGHQAHFYSTGDDPAEEVDPPPEFTASTVAVSVRGDSMADHIENGAILYYDDRRDPPDEALVGKLCIVGLASGQVLVKKLLRGNERNRWHLMSTNAPPLMNQEVEWAAKITWIRPA